MAKSIWSGAISFGLVNVPVKLYSATSPKDVRFHQLSSKTGARIKQKRVDPTTGDQVNFEDIVKGYELTPDRYVLIEPDELDALDPKQTKTLTLEKFVPSAAIDPMIYDKTYYIGPADPTAGKSYRLLVQAMTDAEQIAIGRMVLRTKQHLVSLRTRDGVLVASTMVFADEILDPDRTVELDAAIGEPSEAEVEMAKTLINALSGEFDHAAYRDTYRDKVLDLIERKAAGEEIAVVPELESETSAGDLMAQLTASLATTAKPSKPAAKRTRKSRAAA